MLGCGLANKQRARHIRAIARYLCAKVEEDDLPDTKFMSAWIAVRECRVAAGKCSNIKGECLLMLTDGYIGHQDPSNYATLGMPLLWCVKGNTNFEAVVGKTVHVE